MTPLSDLPVLILDCQATGPASAGGHLLEIGWLRIAAKKGAGCRPEQVAAFRIRLPEGETIPRQVLRVTGIDPEKADGALTPAEAWNRLLEAGSAGSIPAVIHYARFERPFLCRLHDGTASVLPPAQAAPARPFPLEIVCSHEIVRRLLPELPRKGLRAVAGYFNYGLKEHRRCADHVAATARIWFHLCRLLKEKAGIDNWPALLAWLEKTPVPPPVRCFPMDRERLDILSDRPGVYRMRRQSGGLLYIGKARSLRRRVAGYFRPRARHPEHILEMLTQARDLEVCETDTAFSAALQEADEIRRFSPPYNRALRTDKKTLAFISADFTRTAAGPDDDCRIGPLPDERVAAGLCALSRIFSGRSDPPPGGKAEAALPLCFVPDRAPDDLVFREGIETFLHRHQAVFSAGATPQSMMSVARMLWKEKMAAAGETTAEEEAEEEPAESSVREPEWTADRVAGRIEGILRHGGRMIRRSRWFAVLSESALAWAPTAGGRSFRNLIVFQRGKVKASATLACGQPVPAPPGFRHPAAMRRTEMDLSAYQRLRVATTEIRRLLAEGRGPVLRISERVVLGPEKLARMLFWV